MDRLTAADLFTIAAVADRDTCLGCSP